MKREILKAKKECAKVNEEALMKALEQLNLDTTTMEMIKTCLACAKRPQRGRRYTRQWVFECLLMRTKSRKLYSHMRDRKILPLPSFNTLENYIKRFGSAYGFNESIFEAMSIQSENMDPEETRGSWTFNVFFDQRIFELNKNL